MTNALQTALLLASRREVDARQGVSDAVDTLAAIERAALATKELRANAEKEA